MVPILITGACSALNAAILALSPDALNAAMFGVSMACFGASLATKAVQS